MPRAKASKEKEANYCGIKKPLPLPKLEKMTLADDIEGDENEDLDMTVEERVDYLLQDFDSKVDKACETVRGQKTIIKKLYNDCDELIENCTVNTLRKCFWTDSFISCLEGRKICVKSLEKVGMRSAFLLMKRKICAGTSNTVCNHYGELIVMAWKKAYKDEDLDMLKEIECEMITSFAFSAIFTAGPLAAKFHQVLHSVAVNKVDKAKMDSMLFDGLQPVLWRGLKANNDNVRFNAAQVLFSFYPVLAADSEERAEMLDMQHTIFGDLLMDDSVDIRQEAIKKVLKLLSVYWTFIPAIRKREYMTTICDKLSKDADIGTRLVIFEGMRYLLPVPVCLNVTEHALKILCKTGIDDKNERVRAACFNLLRGLKGHRFIKFFDVVTMDEVLARLATETSEAVRKEIVPLIFRSFFPSDVDQNERLRRIAVLIKHGRIAALTFHRMIFGLHLITVKEAVDHIKFISIAVYRTASAGFSEDVTLSNNMTLNDTVGTLSGNSQDLPQPDENNPGWIRMKIMLECMVVVWLSIRSALLEPAYAAEKARLETLGMRIFEKMFKCFRMTSLLGATMLLGSIIPPKSMDSISSSVLSLLSDSDGTECIVEPYLEATAQWRIDHIFDIISSGLDVLQLCSFSQQSPLRKKAKKVPASPNDQLKKAITYLKYVMRSFSTHQIITYEHVDQLESFYKKLDFVRSVIERRLRPESDVQIPDETIITVFSAKFTLCAVVLNCNTNDMDRAVIIVRDLCNCLDWVEAEIIPKLASCEKNSLIVDLCQIVLRHMGLLLKSWDFAAAPTISQAPSYIHNKSDDSNAVCIDFPLMVARTIALLSNVETPSQLIPSVLFSAKELLEMRESSFADVAQIFEMAPRWIIQRCVQEEEVDEKKISEAYAQLWKAVLDCNDCSDAFIDSCINIVAIYVLDYLIELIDETRDIVDPRTPQFDVPSAINIIILKVIFKSKPLAKKFIAVIGGVFCSNALVSDDKDADSCLNRIAAGAQLSYLCDMEARGIKSIGRSESTVRKCSEDVKSLIEVLRGRTREVEERPDNVPKRLLDQVKELLDV